MLTMAHCAVLYARMSHECHMVSLHAHCGFAMTPGTACAAQNMPAICESLMQQTFGGFACSHCSQSDMSCANLAAALACARDLCRRMLSYGGLLGPYAPERLIGLNAVINSDADL